MINDKITNKLKSLNNDSVWIFTKQSMVFDEVFKATRLFNDYDGNDSLEEYFIKNAKYNGLSTDRHRILIIAQFFGLLTKSKYYSSGDKYNKEDVTEIFKILSNYEIGSKEYNIIKTEQILKIKVKAIINTNNQNDKYNLLPVIFSYLVLKQLKDRYGIKSVSIKKFMTYVMTCSHFNELEKTVEFLKESDDSQIYKDITSYNSSSRYTTILRNNIHLFIINNDNIEINPIYEDYFLQNFINKNDILSLHIQILNDDFYKSFLTTYQNFNINLIDEPDNINFSNIINDVYIDDSSIDADYIQMVNQQQECDINTLDDAYKNKPVIMENTSKKYDRNPLIGKIAIIESGYKCINDEMHTTFSAKSSNKQFMEAHHLIPISFQSEIWNRFNVNIDCKENIVSLCPNCHRAIHYSVDKYKQQILEKLYKSKKDDLKKIGIDISFEELLKFYNIK